MSKPPQLSSSFAGYSFSFALSQQAKGSVDLLALARKIREHGGAVVSPAAFSTAKTTYFLITDIKETHRLEKLVGVAALVKLEIVSLDFVDQTLELWERVLKSKKRKVESDASASPSKTETVASSSSSSSSSSTSTKRTKFASTSTQSKRSNGPPYRGPRPKSSSSEGTTFEAVYQSSQAPTSTSSILLPSATILRLPRDIEKALVKALKASATYSSGNLASALKIASFSHLPSTSSAQPTISLSSLLASLSASPIVLPHHPSLQNGQADYSNPDMPPAYFKQGRVLADPGPERDARGVVKNPFGRWSFPREMVERFPALCMRNFFVIQWHQATALHYDLRLQCAFSSSNASDSNFIRLPKGSRENPGTISFAVPKGVHGMPLSGKGNSRYAAQTNLHPISYSTYEGGDGRMLGKAGHMCGTLLWDIGYYTVVSKHDDPDSDGEDESDEHQEKLLMEGMCKRSFEITLHGHHKIKSLTLQFSRTGQKADSKGRLKPEWLFKRTDRGGKAVEVNCEDGGRSCLTGRTLKEVCNAPEVKWAPRLEELGLSMEDE